MNIANLKLPSFSQFFSVIIPSVLFIGCKNDETHVAQEETDKSNKASANSAWLELESGGNPYDSKIYSYSFLLERRNHFYDFFKPTSPTSEISLIGLYVAPNLNSVSQEFHKEQSAFSNFIDTIRIQFHDKIVATHFTSDGLIVITHSQHISDFVIEAHKLSLPGKLLYYLIGLPTDLLNEFGVSE